MRKFMLYAVSLFFTLLVYQSCSKGGSETNEPTDPCAGVTVTVSGTVTDAAAGQSNGSIQVSATGGSNFTFSLNNGAFQSSTNFTNLAAGNYTVTAKNSAGCTGARQFTVAVSSACPGVNISINPVTTTVVPCGGSLGSITVNASGSTGFTYSLNNGAFQAANQFSNLAAGSYTVIAKDAAGCAQTASVSVTNAQPGPLFAAVRSVIQASCVSCHNASRSEGGMNWSMDCNIISNSSRIRARAVDAAGTSLQMPQPPSPPLSAADRQKIVDWINAGGSYSH